MARKYHTVAHATARALRCVRCNRPLTNARYGGEMSLVDTPRVRRVGVYLTCRCRTLNEISLDLMDPTGFLDLRCIARAVPALAEKIVRAPQEAPTL